MKISNILIIIFVLLFYLLLPAKNILAFEPFVEDFNGYFSDISKWNVDTLNSNISFNLYPDFIALNSTGVNFPFIRTNENVFLGIEDSFEISLAFQYRPSANSYGDGIVLTDLMPIYRHTLNDDGVIFQIWNDATNGVGIYSSICSEDQPSCSAKQRFYTPTFIDEEYHRVKFIYFNNKYYVYLDDIKDPIFVSVETLRIPNGIWIGHPGTMHHGAPWSALSVDYIHVDEYPQRLGVPHFSQRDPIWKDSEYDHSSSIGNPSEPSSIGAWGCSVTSAAMILKYYGIDKSPDGLNTNPEVLDNWLENNNGYDLNGWIRWSKVSEYVKKAIENGFLPEDTPDLEYSPISYSYQRVKDLINLNKPAILKIKTTNSGSGTHFVVIRGNEDQDPIESSKVFINDPWDLVDTKAELLDKYSGNTYSCLGVYTPSHTDLSYLDIRLYSDDINMLINYNGQLSGVDEEGIEHQDINTAMYHVNDRIQSPDGSFLGSGQTKIFEYPKPSEGNYSLTFYGNPGTQFNFEANLFDNVASDVLLERTGIIGQNGSTTYILNFNSSEDINDSTLEEQFEELPEITYNFIKQYIQEQYNQGNIYRKILVRIFNLKLRVAKFLGDRGRVNFETRILTSMQRMINRFSPRYINQETANTLIEYIDILMNGYPENFSSTGV